jgi:hypothetical protein
MPALVILRSLKRPVPSPDLASLQVSTVSAAICPMSYGPAATVFRYVTPRGCPATITMSGRIASSRNVPERSGHCLTRMLPWPRHFGNRRPIGSSDWHPKDPAAWGDLLVRAAIAQDRLSCSIGEPAFPSRPGAARAAARNGGDGRSGATRSHAQRALSREHGEDGEHRTFPEVSTVAHSAPVGGPGRRGSTWKRWKHFRRGNATAHPD